MAENPIEHPTYLRDIRFMFTSGDTACMRGRGIDLRTYEGVKLNAQRIYFQVREGTMPLGSSDLRWKKSKVETFYNWMRNDYPRGVAPQQEPMVAAATAGRVRVDLSSLDINGPEIVLLKKAFKGIMERDPSDPQSYFAIAGGHWLPLPEVYCRHHENAYNPWHRVYLNVFEDALRSVEGCEDVTLPYWDITSGSVPEIFSQPPFDSYVIPQKLESLDGGRVYPKGTKTSRYSDNDIIENLVSFGVEESISEALGSSRWEDFNGWHADEPEHTAIIRAHDAGHVASGVTMENQDIAAFDPLFWFFHANWDRLWWRWQQAYSGTTLDDFKTLLIGDPFWLLEPEANELLPFNITADKTIDLSAMDVDYVHPAGEKMPKPQVPMMAAVAASRGLQVIDPEKLVVRVRGIDRLQIPGSFIVGLQVNDETIREQPLFQSTTPQQCQTCRRAGILNLKFIVDRKEIVAGRVGVTIRLVGGKSAGAFPLSQAGNPQIDIKMLMTEQKPG